MNIVAAEKHQAPELAYLINLAGEGIPEFLWSSMIEGDVSAMDVGAMRAAREEGGFSYRNARVCLHDAKPSGMIISYRQPEVYDLGDLDEYPAVVRPLVELEAKAPGSWYVNAIATFEDYRGRGIAQALLQEAEVLAKGVDCDNMSLIVASENKQAKRLYQYLEYRVVSTLPVVDYPGSLHGGDWELMIKSIA